MQPRKLTICSESWPRKEILQSKKAWLRKPTADTAGLWFSTIQRQRNHADTTMPVSAAESMVLECRKQRLQQVGEMEDLRSDNCFSVVISRQSRKEKIGHFTSIKISKSALWKILARMKKQSNSLGSV